MLIRKLENRRSGAALVEMAFVVIIFVMILFGILEYCRFIFFRQIVVNAGREGARYAVTHNLTSSVTAATEARVRTYMAGMDDKLNAFTVQVYQADASGNNIGSAENAEFGEYIAVQIDGDYEPILPTLLRMDQTIHIRSTTLMYSEAN